MTRERFTLGSTRHREPPHEDRPEVQRGVLRITGSRIGALLTVGLGIYLWFALPPFRIFFLAALALGCLIGLVLWRRHR